jgi:DNA invertase Pin-like site-specific DNA recombinase
MRKPIAAYYIRYSSSQQEQSDSVRRQTTLIESYAKANGLVIDEQLSARDLGISAFRGINLESGFGTIKKHIQEKRLIEGDYLLLENLDRFSRHDIFVSAPALFEIINEGVKVVTVSDGQVFSKEGSGLMTMMQSIMQLSRANDESQAKSDRGKAVWEAKRDAFIQGTGDKIMTSMCPNWLKASEDKTQFIVIEERKEIVQKVFNLSDQGIGSKSISKTLNNEETPPFGRAQFWQKSAIDKILKSRAVLGECEFFTAEVQKKWEEETSLYRLHRH